MKKIVLSAITALTALSLAACGGTSTPSTGTPSTGTPSTPGPVTTPLPAWLIPTAGAPVGSGGGVSTVYVSPNSFEIGLMTLINEVRVSGTVNGQPVPAGSCAAGVKGLQPLRYSGLLAHSARMHTQYMQATLDGGHVEKLTSAPQFWAARAVERVKRSSEALNIANERYASEILSNLRRTPDLSVLDYLNSASHCAVIVSPTMLTFGAGWSGDLSLPDPVHDFSLSDEENYKNALEAWRLSSNTVVFGK